MRASQNQPAQRRGFCLTEMSIMGLVAGALVLSGGLWLIIMAVL
jgi:hypothetical protein